MLSDRVLKRFVAAVEAASNVDARQPGAAPGGAALPEEYARMLAATARWRKVRDLWFVSVDAWREDKAHWDGLSSAWESGEGTWEHALWSRDWLPLAHDNSHLQFAYAPTECFGGPAGQVVAFDFKGGEDWDVFESLDAWLDALVTVLELAPPRDLAPGSIEWAMRRGSAVRFVLPEGDAARRSPARFRLGESDWVELAHPDGSRWAIRARRASYQLRLGDPEDPVLRERSCAAPAAEVARLIEEQKAEGFVAVEPRESGHG